MLRNNKNQNLLGELTKENQFIEAASKNDLNTVVKLLREDVHVDLQNNDGCTALHMAVRNDHVGVIEKLIEAKADINVQDKYGRTALHMAALNGHVGVVKELMVAGADINLKNKEGNTALSLSRQNKQVDCINCLHMWTQPKMYLEAFLVRFFLQTPETKIYDRIKKIIDRSVLRTVSI